MFNLAHILTEAKPDPTSEAYSETLSIWEKRNKICRHTILSTLSNELYDIYCDLKTAKEIWNSLHKKYVVEDARNQKYAIGNFSDFKMTEDKDVSSQIHDYHVLVNELKNEEIILPDAFIAGFLIESLPESWKHYKNNLKHKRKLMTLEDIIVHIRIEEKNRQRDNADKIKEFSSKANLIEVGSNKSQNSNRNPKKFKGTRNKLCVACP
ncbi:uncharacterized protein LOC120255315 [Dioscorea cayenensis subsp. rotundata]|uniref:Uncharacterized protein LOC120255315 n=1 Tax=Dioscorea cayennensis subsp. rotundata TaxID=55577 RepID=A0AB40AVR4_DIOCR|nr:uncharacterized protein LOC120255315 [Dioscorea cayenensis subsp. rotundata]